MRIPRLVSVNNAFTVGLVFIVASLHIGNGQFEYEFGPEGIESDAAVNGALHARLPAFSVASHGVAAVCEACDHKEACIESVGSVANKPNANPKDFVQAAIQSTISQVSTALDVVGSIAANSSGSEKMSMEDCKDLLGFAVDELRNCFSTVGGANLQALHDKQVDLLNWLSAVMSYQHTCLDGIFDSQLKKEIMSSGLSSANQLTSNALAIVSTMSTIFDTFQIPMKVGGGGNARALTGFAQGNFGFGLGGHGISGSWSGGIGGAKSGGGSGSGSAGAGGSSGGSGGVDVISGDRKSVV